MNAFLFVCTYNRGRSPTAEHLARQQGYLADSAGSSPLAIRPLTRDAIDRAERIVCMDAENEEAVLHLAPERRDDLEVWHIPDRFGYCAPDLIKLLAHYLQAIRRAAGGRRV